MFQELQDQVNLPEYFGVGAGRGPISLVSQQMYAGMGGRRRRVSEGQQAQMCTNVSEKECVCVRMEGYACIWGVCRGDYPYEQAIFFFFFFFFVRDT